MIAPFAGSGDCGQAKEGGIEKGRGNPDGLHVSRDLRVRSVAAYACQNPPRRSGRIMPADFPYTEQCAGELLARVNWKS